MTRELIIVRTHRLDQAARAQADRFAGDPERDVRICVDGPVADDARCFSLDADALRARGHHLPADYGWRCGDLCFYQALLVDPSYDRYWLIEPDVIVNANPPGAVLDRFRDVEADVLAAHVSRCDEAHFWHSAVSDCYAQAGHLFFPLVRLTRKAIVALEAERIGYGQFRAQNKPGLIANDEVFVASAAMHLGLSLRDFNESALIWTPDTMKWAGVPHALSAILKNGQPGLVYHPVFAGDDFAAAARRAIDSDKVPLRETGMLWGETRRELGLSVAMSLLLRLLAFKCRNKLLPA